MWWPKQSKNYRYSTAHQVVIDPVTRPVAVVGRPLPGNCHDSRDWEESGVRPSSGTHLALDVWLADAGLTDNAKSEPRPTACFDLLPRRIVLSP